MKTEYLIDRLAAEAVPVRPLPSPTLRVLTWLATAAPAVILAVVAMGPRSDLADRLGDGRYLLEQAAAAVTALSAAYAAFSAGIPGRPRWLLMLPSVPLAVWLGSLGQGCVAAWLQAGPEGMTLRADWLCLPAIAMTGAVPAVAMVVMVRRGAPLRPHATTTLAALATAALGNVGLRLFHSEDASLMVLVWQFGAVALLSAAAGMLGRRVLPWHLAAFHRQS